MFFGAGNLMYPLVVGLTSGQYTTFGMIGFLLTAVCLPVLGLISMILFDGNYNEFFNRLGNTLGNKLLALCMFIIGPVIAIPRIVTLSHTMTSPFIPVTLLQTSTPLASFIFACLFLGLTFLATYRATKVVNIIGNIISPILLISLITIIIKGILTAEKVISSTETAITAFTNNVMRGYETLDLLGAIFFTTVIITNLKQSFPQASSKKLATIGLKSGLIGTSLLGLVYVGMSYLGAYHGHEFTMINAGELFREVSFKILGSNGACVIGISVLMACLSTAIALSTITALFLKEQLQKNINLTISYRNSLITILFASIPLSVFGLDQVLALTGGAITYIGYPVIITLTVCNTLYKLTGFKPVLTPTLIIFFITTIKYYWL
jgi:LIVCS family branched-chain amino acid:cation transporter